MIKSEEPKLEAMSTCTLTEEDESSLSSSSSSSSLSSQPVTSEGTPEVPRSAISYCKTALWAIIMACCKGFICLAVFYHFMASPPMDWIYEPLPSAGAASIYLPGGGFSGVFYHLGVLHSMGDYLLDYDYYCYSSGCIAAVAAFLNITLEDASDAGITAQEEWMAGQITKHEFAEQFMNHLLPTTTFDNNNNNMVIRLQQVLPKIKVLVTSPMHGGTEIKEATNREEFIDLIIKTTWLPFVTGWGWLHQGRSMDGGFSRRLHPECEFEVPVPIYWEITKKTFTPAISREEARRFWIAGYGSKEVDIPKQVNKKQPLLFDIDAAESETVCPTTSR